VAKNRKPQARAPRSIASRPAVSDSSAKTIPADQAPTIPVENDRQRILAEETYREEIRAQLASSRPVSLAQRVWDILNKPFLLWTLSTILVGLVTWSWASYQAGLQGESVRRTSISRLDIEMAARIADSLDRLEELERDRRNGVRIANRAWVFGTVVEGLNGGREQIYPEYSARRFTSLLIELQRLIGSEDNLSAALVGYRMLAASDSSGSVVSGRYDEADPRVIEHQAAIVDARQIIEERIQLPRWRPPAATAD
jgi:hypothetical protein